MKEKDVMVYLPQIACDYWTGNNNCSSNIYKKLNNNKYKCNSCGAIYSWQLEKENKE